MGEISTATFTGESGNEYGFSVYTADTPFNNVDAVYIFTKRTVSESGHGSHKLLYIGETDNLAERIEFHEKWECVETYGCNCICVHREADPEIRLRKEADLRRANHTPCNKQ